MEVDDVRRVDVVRLLPEEQTNAVGRLVAQQAEVIEQDWETDAYNLKRSLLDAKPAKQNMLGEPKRFSMNLLTDTQYPRFRFTFGKLDEFREPLEIDADEFIPIRSVATKGKKVSNYYIEKIEEIEPTKVPEQEKSENEETTNEEISDTNNIDSDSLF